MWRDGGVNQELGVNTHTPMHKQIANKDLLVYSTATSPEMAICLLLVLCYLNNATVNVSVHMGTNRMDFQQLKSSVYKVFVLQKFFFFLLNVARLPSEKNEYSTFLQEYSKVHLAL